MEKETQESATDMKQYYVLGAVVLIAVIIAGYLLRPKAPAPTTTDTAAQLAATPTPGQISGLNCDTEYYNPRIGFPEYYLSVEGGDVAPATSVDCTFSASQSGKIVATATVTSPLTESPARGGKTFRCTTQALKLTPKVPTEVTIAIKDDQGATKTCTAPFVFPAP